MTILHNLINFFDTLYTHSACIIFLFSLARVGKTSLSTKFVHGAFDKNMPSTVDASYLEK